MDKREHLTDQFSTFILWENDAFLQWGLDRHLQHHMDQHFQLDPSLTASQYWGIYWHQRFQGATSVDQAEFPRNHLYAYLQEPCYRAASKLFTTYQGRSQFTRSQLFSHGVSRFDTLIAKYNPRLNSNLVAHAHSFLKWRMLDLIREKDKILGQTLWGLLLHINENRLQKALVGLGFTEERVDCHLWAWECYVAIYKPVKKEKRVQGGKVIAPTPEIWSQIAAVYGGLKPGSQESHDSNEVHKLSIQQMLETCGQAIYQAHEGVEVSLNQLNSEGGAEFIEIIPAVEADAPDSLRDYAAIQTQILNWLQVEWQTLDLKKYRCNAQARTMVDLYYGQGVEQKDISRQLGVDQSTISRNLNKVTTILADRFLAWAQVKLHIPLTADDIETVNDAVKVWIRSIYQTQPHGGKAE